MRNSELNEVQVTEIRKAYRRYLSRTIKPNYFLTFNFNYEVVAKHGDAKMRHFFCAIQKKVYGRRWNKQLAREWPTAIGFWEHHPKYHPAQSGNPHWHVLAKVDERLGRALQEKGPTLWQEIIPGGSLDVQAVDPPGKWEPIRYSTKGLWKQEAVDNVFTYCDTRPKSLTANQEFDQVLCALEARIIDDLKLGSFVRRMSKQF